LVEVQHLVALYLTFHSYFLEKLSDLEGSAWSTVAEFVELVTVSFEFAEDLELKKRKHI